ncbi:MAG: hypothetical protein JW839_21815, partial [Candidatus Lokiarchaeota archaeon]|nr:hypothetical protein [Candidatus Lokiarchaeota archaeon]
MQRRKAIFGIIAAVVCSILVFLVINGFLALDAMDPNHAGHFTFVLPEDLTQPANGLAWTLTIALTLFYWVAGLFLVMEGKLSTVEVQKKFHYHLAFMFVLIGMAQGLVAAYSILTEPVSDGPPAIPAIFPGIVNLLPGVSLFKRGDALFALALACCSSVFIIHSIEKYIRNSKRYPLTILVVIGGLCGVGAIIVAYLKASVWAVSAPEWVEYLEYGLTGFMIVGMAITILALPIIYFALARQTSGAVKKNSLTIAWGFLVTFLMVLLHLLRDVVEDMPLNWMVFIFGNIVGALI